jgi:hypothetical protein
MAVPLFLNPGLVRGCRCEDGGRRLILAEHHNADVSSTTTPPTRVVALLGQRVADRGELVMWSPAVVVLRSDANGSRPMIRTYALSRFRVEVEP